jgi:hypothetical protein
MNKKTPPILFFKYMEKENLPSTPKPKGRIQIKLCGSLV